MYGLLLFIFYFLYRFTGLTVKLLIPHILITMINVDLVLFDEKISYGIK